MPSDDLSCPAPSTFQLSSIVTEDDGFFKFTNLGEQGQDAQGDQVSSCESEVEAQSSIETEHDGDIWLGLDKPVEKPATLKTWESFINQEPSINRSVLITEAGSTAYDALLAQETDPLKLQNTGASAIDQRSYFSALLGLALGQESVLYQKDETDFKFKSALPSVRISGYSTGVLEGLERQCRTCGRLVLELQSLTRRTYLKSSLQCQTALASILDDILQSVKQNTVALSHNPRSLLQLQCTVQGILSILHPLYKLASKLDRARSNDEIVSHVFHHSASLQSSEQWLQEIFQLVLRRVSGPWTEFLEEWIGTKQEDGIPFTKSEANIGQYKGFVKVDTSKHIDESGEEVAVVDFILDRAKVPPFMPKDVVQTLFETGSNLRFIRASHPEHPLSQAGVLSNTQPPKAGWLFDWESILQHEVKVVDYRDRLVQTMVQGPGDLQPPSRTPVVPCEAEGGYSLDLFTFDEKRIGDRILASMAQLSAIPPTDTTNMHLDRIVRQRLGTTKKAVSDTSNTTPHWSLLPILCFGSIISAQAQVVNREMLRLLFTAHDLRGNLGIQREFHLLGNGLFCSRLSHALFDPELEMTERRAGVARQGGMMGLRLGRRDTWPPASSELRLALMGVLTESYHSQCRDDENADLPGNLSFAVRDLSEEEINKCMDADSLEALDFLRLSYQAPAELRCIITSESLAHYDQIFRHLLRILRMLYVVNQLWREVIGNQEELDATVLRFVRESHHFVSSISSYLLDTGIGMPWQAFEKKLDNIEASLQNTERSKSEEFESPDQLQLLHSQTLKTILSALFLRKRQEPILHLISDILSTILEFAKYHRDKGFQGIAGQKQAELLYSKARKKIQIFITVCRGLVEKNRTNRGNESAASALDGMGEESMVSQLLLKLDMNNYYVK